MAVARKLLIVLDDGGGGGGGGPPDPGNTLLTESGTGTDSLLLESGDYLLLES